MKTAKLGELVKITIGRTPSRGNEMYWDKVRGTSNIWLSIADLLSANGRTVNDSKEYITNEAAEAFAIVPRGTLLVSFKLTLGRLAYAGCDLRTNEAIAALHNDEKKILNDYLYHFLSWFDWSDYAAADQKVKGLTLNKAKLAEITVIYPESLEEQRQIVTRLDAAFEKIDEAIENTEKNLQNIQELIRSEVANLIDSVKSSEIKHLPDISSNLDSRRIPITKKDRKSGSIPYYGASGIVDCVKEYIFDEDILLISEDGANLLARVTPIAFSVSGKSWVNNHAHVLGFDSATTQKYIEFYLNSINLKAYITGTAQPKLNQAKLNKIPIHIPDIERQEEIVERFDVLSGQTRKLQKLYQEKLDNLRALKQSLLREAFSTSEVE